MMVDLNASCNLTANSLGFDDWSQGSDSCLSVEADEKLYNVTSTITSTSTSTNTDNDNDNGDPLHMQVDSPPTEVILRSATAHVVSFSNWIDVREIAHFNDYTPQETSDTWLSQPDYTLIKRKAKQSVAFKVKYGLKDDDLEFCAHGLETKQDTELRRSRRKEAVDAVLNEQYLQRVEVGTNGSAPELVAMLYSVFSFPCIQRAHSQALQDAIDVDDQRFAAYCHLMNLEDQDRMSEMPYPGEIVLSRIAQEMPSFGQGEDPMESVERWLVDRFQKGERLVQIRRVRQYTIEAHVAVDRE